MLDLKVLVLVLVATHGCLAAYDYEEALEMSLLFYEAQRSGPLPSDNRIDWRGDSAMGDEITGGYYDAGDHVKFGFPMASMTTQLAWGGITFNDGYKNAGQVDYMKDCLKWATDYFIAAHPSANEFYGQIGDGDADHAYWGRPEEMTMSRPAFKITDSNGGGADLAGETAAALAAASIFYKNNGDSGAADEALSHARQLFDFADQHRQPYVVAIPQASNFYNSWSGYQDELAWAAAWMYKATNEDSYLSKAEQMYSEFNLNYTPTEFGWDNKIMGLHVLLYEMTGKDEYKSRVDAIINYILNEAQYTPKGLIYIDSWGSNRHAANLAHLMSQIAALGYRQSECENFADSQIDYILGDSGRSFVVGFGNNPPTRPHHRSSSCPDLPASCDWPQYDSPDANPQTLFGALVGGPNNNDGYNDDRHDYESNEVATDYNAGFQSALAALVQRNA